MSSAGRHPRRGRRIEPSLGLNKVDDALKALALPQIGHDKGPLATHAAGIDVHLFQRGADMRRKVDLVDDEQIRPGDTGAAFRLGLW